MSGRCEDWDRNSSGNTSLILGRGTGVEVMSRGWEGAEWKGEKKRTGVAGRVEEAQREHWISEYIYIKGLREGLLEIDGSHGIWLRTRRTSKKGTWLSKCSRWE